MFRRLPFLILALLGVDFIDEFLSGMPMIGVPGIQREFELRYATAAFLIFTAPQAMGLLLEPPLYVLADRYPRKRFVVGGLLAMALCALVVGLAPWLWVVGAGLLFSAAASGCGVNIAQATLIDANPDDQERTMTRWVFMGSMGDLAAPMLFGGLALVAWGWREAFLISAAIVAAYALVLMFVRFPEPARPPDSGQDGEEALGYRAAVVAAFRNKRLLFWLTASWLCNLLDEILVAFGALFLANQLGADDGERSVVLLCMMSAAVVGLLVTDRLLSRSEPLRVLRAACVGCGLAYVGWLVAPGIVWSAVLLSAVGFFGAALYPITHAQAYRALPGQSGMVNAVSHIFTPLGIVLPLALGFLADAFGLVAALAVLLAQPLGILLIASLPFARESQAS